jgi:hypothetical protein
MSSASTKRVNLSSTTQPSFSPRPIRRASGSAQCYTKMKSKLWTEKSAKSYDRPSEKCARSHECFAPKIQSGMLRNIRGQQDAQMSRAVSIAFEAARSVAETSDEGDPSLAQKAVRTYQHGRTGKLYRRQIATHHGQINQRLHRAPTGSRSGSARPRCILRR